MTRKCFSRSTIVYTVWKVKYVTIINQYTPNNVYDVDKTGFLFKCQIFVSKREESLREEKK